MIGIANPPIEAPPQPAGFFVEWTSGGINWTSGRTSEGPKLKNPRENRAQKTTFES